MFTSICAGLQVYNTGGLRPDFGRAVLRVRLLVEACERDQLLILGALNCLAISRSRLIL